MLTDSSLLFFFFNTCGYARLKKKKNGFIVERGDDIPSLPFLLNLLDLLSENVEIPLKNNCASFYFSPLFILVRDIEPVHSYSFFLVIPSYLGCLQEAR